MLGELTSVENRAIGQDFESKIGLEKKRQKNGHFFADFRLSVVSEKVNFKVLPGKLERN